MKDILTIELVPRTSWFNNVRSNVDPKIWEKLKKVTARKAKYRCQICGGCGDEWPVECHEIWDYDDATHIQKLLGLIALCPDCHKVKHLGHTSIIGDLSGSVQHLAAVNNWSLSEAENYISEQFKIWSERSKHEWTLDINFLVDKTKK